MLLQKINTSASINKTLVDNTTFELITSTFEYRTNWQSLLWLNILCVKATGSVT